MNEIKSSFHFLKVFSYPQEEFMKVLNFFPPVTYYKKLCLCFPISSLPFYHHLVSITPQTYVEKGVRCLVKCVAQTVVLQECLLMTVPRIFYMLHTNVTFQIISTVFQTALSLKQLFWGRGRISCYRCEMKFKRHQLIMLFSVLLCRYSINLPVSSLHSLFGAISGKHIKSYYCSINFTPH